MKFAYLPLVLAVSVCVSCDESGMDSTAEAATETPPTKAKPWDWIPEDPALLAGRDIYQSECALCHNEGEEGAPALTRTAEWETRIAQGEATLFKHALEGFKGEDGEMPARGGTEELTDQQVMNAVRFMIATPK